jgi:hypothetical protein
MRRNGVILQLCAEFVSDLLVDGINDFLAGKHGKFYRGYVSTLASKVVNWERFKTALLQGLPCSSFQLLFVAVNLPVHAEVASGETLPSGRLLVHLLKSAADVWGKCRSRYFFPSEMGAVLHTNIAGA